VLSSRSARSIPTNDEDNYTPYLRWQRGPIVWFARRSFGTWLRFTPLPRVTRNRSSLRRPDCCEAGVECTVLHPLAWLHRWTGQA